MDVAAWAVRENENGDESAAPDHSTGPDASAYAQALLQGNYGIIRTQDKRQQDTTSWLVRLRRDGRRVGTRYFYHHHYDSPEAALAYRNALLQLCPPLTSARGVQRVSQDTGGPGYWIAPTRYGADRCSFRSGNQAGCGVERWPCAMPHEVCLNMVVRREVYFLHRSITCEKSTSRHCSFHSL